MKNKLIKRKYENVTCFLIEIDPDWSRSAKNTLVAGAMYFSTNVDRAHVSPIRNIRFFPRQRV